ncbi:sigma-54-dependent Fis family transcriptional regulator [Zoogloea dura]|uniref:Sigma 54-interacting transcriptional regulator n=1 Tax=Zoogloea dura TaxID=2728840 RepID=A0A848GDP2_9RHOO|nr:sigma-54-dependent Fis family transcriptional regulator [Zoogloea dura]NML27581.1 sigma 54-interacting transcriptional regulator [Zoogloea dura]
MSEPRPRRLTSIPREVDDNAISKYVRFAPDSGQILLFDQRMLLMHGFTLAALRQELIERLGLERTRELFTRLGYQQGMEDARHLHASEKGELERILAYGPRLREMEGFVRNQAVDHVQFNLETGDFWSDYYWESSWEAEVHLKQAGISGSPACWMMTGYATGFTTALMGRPILWREIECVAMGHARCRVIGQPLEECDDAEAHLRFLQVEDFVTVPKRRGTRSAPAAGDTEVNRSLPDLIGASSSFNTVAYLIKRVAPTDATVLLTGESGVGKERFSKALHAIGPRTGKPFVSINCAAIPHELVEAELFGVEKGAFTGATVSRPGRFERASGGTLFLDEISSLPLHAQGKLLRVLQEGELERVGDTQLRQVDVRIIAATNRDLRSEVEAGRFREDLFFRLNVFPVKIPPLRERLEDIPLLVDAFVKRYAGRFAKHIAGLTQNASEKLRAYDWPGNIRELENIIERAVILAEDHGSIDVEHLFSGGEQVPNTFAPADPPAAAHGSAPAAAASPAAPPSRLIDGILDAGLSLDEVESLLIDAALERSGGNLSAAARLLKLRRGQFQYRSDKRSGRTG